MIDLFKEKQSVLLEAEKAKRKPPIIVLLLVFAVIMFLIYPLITVPIISVISIINVENNVHNVLILFSTLIYVGLTFIYCRFIEKRSFHSLGFNKNKWFRKFLLGYLIGIFLIAITVLILTAFGMLHFDGQKEVNFLFYFLILLGYLIQGTCEEIFVRGFLLTSLSAKTNIIASVIISSAAFSLLHILNANTSVLAFVNIFFFGVLMSLVFLLTNSIWLVSGIHAAWNFFQGHVFGISVSGSPVTQSVLQFSPNKNLEILSGGDFGVEASIITTIILILSSACVILISVKRSKNKKEQV